MSVAANDDRRMPEPDAVSRSACQLISDYVQWTKAGIMTWRQVEEPQERGESTVFISTGGHGPFPIKFDRYAYLFDRTTVSQIQGDREVPLLYCAVESSTGEAADALRAPQGAVHVNDLAMREWLWELERTIIERLGVTRLQQARQPDDRALS
jgi:hypothetical protein